METRCEQVTRCRVAPLSLGQLSAQRVAAHAGLLQHFLDVQLVGEHQYSASLLHSHDTSTRATMNVAVGDGVIAAGQDGTCCVMETRVCKREEGSAAAAAGGEPSCSQPSSAELLVCVIKHVTRTSRAAVEAPVPF